MFDAVGPVLCHRCRHERARQARVLGPNEGLDLERFCKRCQARLTNRLEQIYQRSFSH